MSQRPDTWRHRFDQLTVGLLVAGAAIVPLVWWPGSGDPFGAPKVRVLRIGMAVVIVIAGLAGMRGAANQTRHPTLLEGALLAWVAWNGLAFIGSMDHRQSLYGEEFQYHGFLFLLVTAATFVIARRVFTSPRTMRALLAALATAGLLVASYAVAQQAGADPWWPHVEFGRPPHGQVPVFSSIGHASALAVFLATAAAAALSLLTVRGVVRRVVALVAIAVMTTAVAFTANRGGYFALVLAALVMGLAALPGSREGRRRLAAAVAVALSVITIAIATIPPVRSLAVTVWDRTATIAEPGTSTRVRLELWRVGMRIAADHPLLGTGQDTFPQAFADYREEGLDPQAADWFSRRRAESPHNLFITISAEAGFPSLAAFLLVTGTAVYLQATALRRSSHSTTRATLAAALAASTAFLFGASFMNPEVTTTWVFWLLLGAGTGLAESVIRREGARVSAAPG